MASSTCRALHRSQQLRFIGLPPIPLNPEKTPCLGTCRNGTAEKQHWKFTFLPHSRQQLQGILRFSLDFWVVFCNGCGWISSQFFQETVHIDTVCAPNQRIQRFCWMVGKTPTSPLKAWVLSLEVRGMWCYILQNMIYALACACHVYCPRSRSTPSATFLPTLTSSNIY